jgi:hypothetical protein
MSLLVHCKPLLQQRLGASLRQLTVAAGRPVR